jgi:hypothetical protein
MATYSRLELFIHRFYCNNIDKIASIGPTSDSVGEWFISFPFTSILVMFSLIYLVYKDLWFPGFWFLRIGLR